MKLLFRLLVLAGIITYLGFAFGKFTRQGDTLKCNAVRIIIADSLQPGFITSAEVDRILRSSHLYPVGKLMDSVSSHGIEQVLMRNAFIRDAECYKTANGCFNILISQRLPLVRVMTAEGEDFYIDTNGKPMHAKGYRASVPVATGTVGQAQLADLVALGNFLKENVFWEKQVQQINVLPEGDIEIIPRVGEQVIFLGKAENLRQKFDNLKLLYEHVMPEVGWNKYTAFNIAYENQVICTKNNK